MKNTNDEQTQRLEVMQDIYNKLNNCQSTVISVNFCDEVIDAFDTRYYIDFDQDGNVVDMSFEKIPTA